MLELVRTLYKLREVERDLLVAKMMLQGLDCEDLGLKLDELLQAFEARKLALITKYGDSRWIR
jgi:hypothetical protein